MEDRLEDESYLSPKYIIGYFIVVIVLIFVGFMYVANKKMIQSGIHEKMNKKSKKKKSKENWSLDG